jgi:hypothetical protein
MLLCVLRAGVAKNLSAFGHYFKLFVVKTMITLNSLLVFAFVAVLGLEESITTR